MLPVGQAQSPATLISRSLERVRRACSEQVRVPGLDPERDGRAPVLRFFLFPFHFRLSFRLPGREPAMGGGQQQSAHTADGWRAASSLVSVA